MQAQPKAVVVRPRVMLTEFAEALCCIGASYAIERDGQLLSDSSEVSCRVTLTSASARAGVLIDGRSHEDVTVHIGDGEYVIFQRNVLREGVPNSVLLLDRAAEGLLRVDVLIVRRLGAPGSKHPFSFAVAGELKAGEVQVATVSGALTMRDWALGLEAASIFRHCADRSPEVAGAWVMEFETPADAADVVVFAASCSDFSTSEVAGSWALALNGSRVRTHRPSDLALVVAHLRAGRAIFREGAAGEE